MKKQLNGIALILFGILVSLASASLDYYITHSVTVPWVMIGLVIGIIGVILVFLKPKDDNR
jgi:drug/metabolite transporter (DMT)-like permease